MLRKCSIYNVRNLAFLELPELSAMNLIVGPNGTGKTSILEAINFLSLARSFRTSSFKKIIKQEADHLIVHGVLADETKIGVQKDMDGTLKVRIDDADCASIADSTLKLPVQVIDPEAFRLLQDGPEARRKFFDWGVYQKFPVFYGYWRDYQRLLKQRNAAIRAMQPADMVSLWDQQLIKATLSIDELRQAYLALFLPIFKRYYEFLLPDLDIQVSYYSGWTEGEAYEDVLAARLLKDMELGYTFAGPHRFDIKIKSNKMFAADIFSRGQQKLTVIAMKLAQASLCAEERQVLFLLDDIAAELDEQRRGQLASLIAELNCQTFITGVERGLLEAFSNEQTCLIEPSSLAI